VESRILQEPYTRDRKGRASITFSVAAEKPMLAALRQGLAEAGGLISYGIDLNGCFYRAAYYVDRILGGRQTGRPTG
jgi:ABC-type uncharacterized transport system substrate-binding protein